MLTIAKATVSASPASVIEPCEPPLNARKPRMRMKAPSAVRGTEWPGKLTTLPDSENLPFLGPMK